MEREYNNSKGMTSIFSNNVSIGQRTGTRIDSSAKHIVACRVDQDFFREQGEPMEKILKQKYLYAMMKDEIVINCSIRTDNTLRKVCYPYVITTLGQEVTEENKRELLDYYNEINSLNIAMEDRPYPFPRQLRFQGISVGTGFASDLSGDTFASAMIGGMVTIINGNFPAFTGDLVQWYFDFEEVMFDAEGYRLPDTNHLRPGTVQRQVRRRFLGNEDPVARREAELETVARRNMYGTYKQYNQGKHNVFFMKSLMPRKNRQLQIEEIAEGDLQRVIGKVINGGGPWEQVDIMITNVFLP